MTTKTSKLQILKNNQIFNFRIKTENLRIVQYEDSSSNGRHPYPTLYVQLSPGQISKLDKAVPYLPTTRGNFEEERTAFITLNGEPMNSIRGGELSVYSELVFFHSDGQMLYIEPIPPHEKTVEAVEAETVEAVKASPSLPPMVDIYHMKPAAKIDFNRTAGTVIPEFDPDYYEHVASLELDVVKQNAADLGTGSALSASFKMTNSIESHWSNNYGVWGDSGTRSTSIGDVIKMPDGQRYLVDDFGFKVF